MSDVVIVGAGMAGLVCAADLTRAGIEVTVVEASDGIGGRVRTDEVDGFRLDRGFQILLTGYPQVKQRIDLARPRAGPVRTRGDRPHPPGHLPSQQPGWGAPRTSWPP